METPGLSNTLFTDQQQYESAPLVLRPESSTKRAMPYHKIRTQGNHQKQNKFPKQKGVKKSVIAKKQHYISDLNAESSTSYNQNAVDTFMETAEVGNHEVGNQSNHEGNFSDQNLSELNQDVLEGDGVNAIIKAEPADVDSDMNEADNAGRDPESVSDSIYTSQWETTGSLEQSDGSFDTESQSYGKYSKIEFLIQGSNLARFSTCIFSQVEFLATC